MNNNEMKFDPMTGKPLDQNTNGNIASNANMTVSNVTNVPSGQAQQSTVTVSQIPVQESAQPTTQPVNTAENIQSVQPVNTSIAMQQQMQNIPTVEQNRQEFINNTQVNNEVKKQEKKNGPNIVFIVILFVIIFAAIFFLFPYLLENL